MPLHPVGTMEGEILPSGAMIFTPMELTVIALARSENDRVLRTSRCLAQALSTIGQRLTGRRGIWTLADARLEALRAFVNSVSQKTTGASVATLTLEAAGFSRPQVT